MRNKESARERILRVASDLFYREGIRAVGIDRIIDESGVAKASFYRGFTTKDELTVAYLEARVELKLEKLELARQLHPDSPRDQLHFIIQDAVERMRLPTYRGCPFVNAVIEFPDPGHPAHAKALQVLQNFWHRVEEIARESGARHPEELAAQLQMIYTGFLMKGYMDKSAADPEHFRHAAEQLIERHYS